MDGKALDAKEVAKLADLESRDVLMGKLAGAMLASLPGCLPPPQRSLAPGCPASPVPWRRRRRRTPRSSQVVPDAGSLPRTPRPPRRLPPPMRPRPRAEAPPTRLPPRRPSPPTPDPAVRADVHHLRKPGREHVPTATDWKETPSWRSSAPTSFSTRSGDDADRAVRVREAVRGRPSA